MQSAFQLGCCEGLDVGVAGVDVLLKREAVEPEVATQLAALKGWH